jgi:hypothetical protein
MDVVSLCHLGRLRLSRNVGEWFQDCVAAGRNLDLILVEGLVVGGVGVVLQELGSEERRCFLASAGCLGLGVVGWVIKAWNE